MKIALYWKDGTHEINDMTEPLPDTFRRPWWLVNVFHGTRKYGEVTFKKVKRGGGFVYIEEGV